VYIDSKCGIFSPAPILSVVADLLHYNKYTLQRLQWSRRSTRPKLYIDTDSDSACESPNEMIFQYSYRSITVSKLKTQGLQGRE